jgi:hypothetical protein
VGIAAITVALGEVATRAVLDIEPLTTESLVWKPHPRWGWAHRALARDEFVKLATHQTIEINSRGLREREIPYEKPSGTYRILVLGDSAAVGFEVAPEDVYTRVAESLLRERGYPVQFVNAGHRGYGTDQSLLYLMDEGVHYAPDLVLYHWTRNDVDDNVTIHRPYRRFGKGYFDFDGGDGLVLRGVPVPPYPYDKNLRVGPDGQVVELDVSLLDRVVLWSRDAIICRSAFATALVHVLAALPQLASTIRGASSYEDFSDVSRTLDRSSRRFRVTAALVGEMRRVSERAGAEFRMIGAGDPWSRALREELELPDLGVYALFFWSRPHNQRIHVPFDLHLNELGHRLYGEALATALADSGLLPNPTGGTR